ncbi:KIF17 protein, partial [Aegotheles bennettii]|nr:KIF17 protein [Aegotheles bennettii]
LQMLECQVVGGEQAENKDLKEKHQRRKRVGRDLEGSSSPTPLPEKYADEQRLQLVTALQQVNRDSSDWVLLNVYDSIQEEDLFGLFMSQLRAAKTEIKDLQSEFELEKIDYLSTIRCLERDLMLSCNYSNLEKIKRESIWDEETGCWKIPEPVIEKTHLP